MHLLRLSIILESFSSLHVVLDLVTLRLATCDSFVELGQSSMSAIISRFPEACSKRRISFDLKYFGVLHVVFSRRKLSCEQFVFSIFFVNFYNAFFQRRLVYHDGLDSVCRNSFLRYGQMKQPVLGVLLRSSMNLMIHFSRFLGVCNHYCFAGIVVATICTPPIVEEMFVFLLYERVHPVHLHVLFFLLPFQLL